MYKSQDEQSYAEAELHKTAMAVYVASANEQAPLLNQMPQLDGMWIRRDALGQSVCQDQNNSAGERKCLVGYINCWFVETGQRGAVEE